MDCALINGGGSLMAKMFASQPQDCGFEPNSGHDYVSSFDTSIESDWYMLKERVSQSSIKNMFKLIACRFIKGPSVLH
jgi:hypothetical protein